MTNLAHELRPEVRVVSDAWGTGTIVQVDAYGVGILWDIFKGRKKPGGGEGPMIDHRSRGCFKTNFPSVRALKPGEQDPQPPRPEPGAIGDGLGEIAF